MKEVSERTFVMLLIAPAALFLLALVAYPLVLLVSQSFYNVELLALDQRTFIGLDNYVNALTSARVLESAWRTLIYTVITLSAEFLLGLGVALVFYAMGKKSELPRTIFLFPLMVAPIVAGLLWRFMLIDNFGVVNWLLYWLGLLTSPSDISWLGNPNIVLYTVALPDIWLTTCFVALVLFTGLQGISPELLEAAKIDGASPVRTFWHIMLPLLRPVIAVVLIIRGLDAARTFDAIFIQTGGGPQNASEVLSLQIYRTMIRYGRLGEASATATLFLIALLVLSMIAYYSLWRPDTSAK